MPLSADEKRKYNKRYYEQNTQGKQWRCDICDCTMALSSKGRHLDSPKHRGNEANLDEVKERKAKHKQQQDAKYMQAIEIMRKLETLQLSDKEMQFLFTNGMYMKDLWS